MKGLSAAVKVGILFAVLVIGGYSVWKYVGGRPSGGSDFEVWAKLSDASGLPVGSRVVIAGLPVGEISSLAVEGRYARVTMRIREDVPLYDNAIAFKKSASLLGDFYIEIDPGTEKSVDATGAVTQNRRLESGDEIKRVVEATSPDQLMRRIEEVLPRVDTVLVSVRDLSENVRSLVNGPIKSIAERIDDLVQNEADTLASILQRTDRTIARIEDIARDIRGFTGDEGQLSNILSNLDEASAEARVLVTNARKEVEETGAALREKIDSFDEIIEPTSSVMNKIDDDKGTLGRLINDSTIADNVEEITEDAKGFLGSIFGMQTYVGLRSEYSLRSGLGRYYVTLDLQTRPDKFYYIELEKGPRGDYPKTTLSYDPALGRWRRDVTIEDEIRFTFQFAKRIDWLTLRYGIKESTGGVGADMEWFDRRLKLSVDVFDATFDQLPRLKFTAAYKFFGYLYVLGGIDEVLNDPDSLDIEPINDDVPIQFEELAFGRDWFLGASIRFNDLDLAALLTVGGSALAGVLD